MGIGELPHHHHRHARAYAHVHFRLQQEDAQETPLYKITHLTYVCYLLYHVNETIRKQFTVTYCTCSHCLMQFHMCPI